MTEKLTTIVVRLRPNHPNGQRFRAGFKFGPQPSRIQVTDAELKMIQEDSFLLIVKGGTGVEQAQDLAKHAATQPAAPKEAVDEKEKEKTIDDFTKKEIIAELKKIGCECSDKDSKQLLRDMLVENRKSDGNAQSENLQDLSVDELVKRLEEKGLKEGTDFNASADKQSLIDLLLA